jgi:iron complex outermembrane recepter protein
MVSRQKEIGIKADVGGMFLTAALFDTEKAYEYTTAANVYAQEGRQNHRGLEFNATGKLTPSLTLVSGVTLIDAQLKGGPNDGKKPLNVANTIAKVYAEYALPVPGLSLNGGLYHTAKQWANATNTDPLPAYTTADLGVRYETQATGRPLTLRLNINNVADKSYWANGYYLGAPRSVAFSAQMQF